MIQHVRQPYTNFDDMVFDPAGSALLVYQSKSNFESSESESKAAAERCGGAEENRTDSL